jgi:two-component system, response regulator FlrC
MRLLIIGSLNGYMGEASKIAIGLGVKVLHCDEEDGGLHALRSGQGADLVFIDVQLNVSRFMLSVQQERIATPVIACGLGADTQAAVKAIKSGAKEYVPLPPDPELIAAVFAAVAEEDDTFIFQDPAMAETMRLADQIAPSEATVLLNGESGTGKEVLSRYIHRKSKRAKQKFISVNCAAIPENLLESELFGHEKGAFTGAVARRIGKFEEADGGTLLLDEISEMHPRLQAKLLRAVQERVVDRVGGSTPIKVDIRLICTTNRDLEAHVRNGDFREDLYFRINVVSLTPPPLRERTGDIMTLAEHFVSKYAAANGIDPLPFSKDAEHALMTHPWPGNVRELENAMHRAILLAQGNRIEPSAIMLTSKLARTVSPISQTTAAATFGVPQPHPPQPVAQPQPTPAGGAADGEEFVARTVASVERDLIIDTLEHCLGNRTHAANVLGISIRTLRNKLKLYAGDGLRVPPPSAQQSYASQ